MKSLTEPFKKTFVIDAKAKTLTFVGARSKPLSSWRYSWRFDEIEKFCFTEERKGVPNGLQLRIKGRKKPIDIEFLRCHGGSKNDTNRSKSGDMVTLYKEFVSLVPGINSVSDRMLQVYESSLAQWDKGDVGLSDIEVPDLQEEGEISTAPRE
jgi:hypothetical protein